MRDPAARPPPGKPTAPIARCVAAARCGHARGLAAATCLLGLLVLAGCSPGEPEPRPKTPAEVRAQVVQLMPATTAHRADWAADIQAAFAALGIEPTAQNLCATLAVTEQESTFNPDPVVPGLAKIARAEIDRRAAQVGLPRLVVTGALMLKAPGGRTYGERLASVRTEQELSAIFEELIGRMPMGRRLFAGANPVHTGGPMQVSIAFAERYAQARPYPYQVVGSIRDEVFSRRGGLYFGIAHLLGYPASYRKPLYRFADFNAGWYASRNAAFQRAVSLASGIPIALDGDLVNHGDNEVGTTEAAVRSLASTLSLSEAQIRRALEQGDHPSFETSTLYERVFALAEHDIHGPLARAVVPRIALESPKITRKLTTEWFATRVDQRYQRCMAKPAAR